jgi:hypothetical protein
MQPAMDDAPHPLQVEGFKRMTPAQKLRMVADLYEAGIRLTVLASVTNPPLTTVRLPMAEIGASAAAYLLRALGAAADPFRQELPVSGRRCLRSLSAAPEASLECGFRRAVPDFLIGQGAILVARMSRRTLHYQ